MTVTAALPTERTTPRTGWQGKHILLYGPYKSGKSTLASELSDNALFLATDPSGHDALSIYREPVNSWQDFLNIAASLRDGGDQWPFDLYVVDTVDELARQCAEHVLAGMAKSAGLSAKDYIHASDFDWGKGYDAVSNEFRLKVAKFCNLGHGVIFISHEKESPIKTRSGLEVVKLAPDVGAKGMRKWLLGFVDVIAHSAIVDTSDGKQHVLELQGTETMEAGGRVPRGEELPAQIPLSAVEFKAALDRAS
jgi:hypothetical protein